MAVFVVNYIYVVKSQVYSNRKIKKRDKKFNPLCTRNPQNVFQTRNVKDMDFLFIGIHNSSFESTTTGFLAVCFVCLMALNATFNNISAISCRSVLSVEETGGPGENMRFELTTSVSVVITTTRIATNFIS